MSGPAGDDGYQDPVAALLAANAARRGDAGQAAAPAAAPVARGGGADRRADGRGPRPARGPRAPRRPRRGGGDAGAHGDARAGRAGGAARRLLAGLLLPLAAIGLAGAGLLVDVPGGVSGTAWVTAALVTAWALCGAATAWAPERTPQWQQAAGALLGAVAFSADRLSA